jgi:1-acyl-sn-glycerol-3-phosphate acyltransferase
MRVTFGRPVEVARYAGRSDDRMLLRQITDEVMFEIGRMSGQKYVDTYAGRGTERGSEALPADTARIETPNGQAPARRSSAEVLR